MLRLPAHRRARQRRRGRIDLRLSWAPVVRRYCAPCDQPSRAVPGSAIARFCCKSPKTSGDNFLARRRSKSRSLIDMASDSLPKSPVSSSPCDEVPSHIYQKVASTARKIFIPRCKRTSATKSPQRKLSAGNGVNPMSQGPPPNTPMALRRRPRFSPSGRGLPMRGAAVLPWRK